MLPLPKFSSVRRLSLPNSWASFSAKLTRSLLARMSCVAKLAGERAAGRVPEPLGKLKFSGADAGLGGATAMGAVSVRLKAWVLADSVEAACGVVSGVAAVIAGAVTRGG